MRSGELNRRITLQQRSAAQDTSGQRLLVWIDVATVWAKIEPLSGRMVLAAQAVESSVTHQITIRYQAQFANPKTMAAMRATLVKDGITRYFNINAAHDENEHRHVLVMDAEEGLVDG